jgi:hypothetical protein
MCIRPSVRLRIGIVLLLVNHCTECQAQGASHVAQREESNDLPAPLLLDQPTDNGLPSVSPPSKPRPAYADRSNDLKDSICRHRFVGHTVEGDTVGNASLVCVRGIANRSYNIAERESYQFQPGYNTTKETKDIHCSCGSLRHG